MIVTQSNNISQFGNSMNLFLFKRKNLDTTRHNPKTQTNKQQNDIEQKTRSAFVTLRCKLRQTPIDSDPPNTCPVDFKFKNLPARESHNNIAQVYQVTEVLSPYLTESHDQTHKAFRVTNVNSNELG